MGAAGVGVVVSLGCPSTTPVGVLLDIDDGITTAAADWGVPVVGGDLVATAEINLGTVAQHSGKFTLTDAAIKPTSKLLVQLAPGPYTGKGTRADEAQMYPGITFAASPGAGQATVYWSAPRGGAAKRNIKVNYQIG